MSTDRSDQSGDDGRTSTDKQPQLGRYKLVSRIATGGMAEIFVARMEGYAGSRRLCVIKKIRPRIASDPRAVQMFLDEARIAATLQHPNIVQMFEVGEMEKNYFIAMEYLHGEDMRTVMRALTREGLCMGLDHAVHIATDLLAGLHYAHEKRGMNGRPLGIVHRDVSPHNVFVTYDGAVKIVDFGIAKATNREHQTKVETLKGKIQYMSPEQCRCVELDHRSDIYSVGIVLYELSTGRRLNSGDDEYEIMKRTVEGPLPRPSDVVDGYPSELEEIVRMALEKKPGDRFQSALEMQQALENFAHEKHLRRSSIELSKFMHRLFRDRIETWQRGMAEGTSIRELVMARHHTRSDTSGPTFDSLSVELDGPSRPIVALGDGDLGMRPQEERDARSDLYPSLSADDAATVDRSPIETIESEVAPRDKVEDEASRPGRGRWLVIVAVILLFSAMGVVVGLKLRETTPSAGAALADAGEVRAAPRLDAGGEEPTTTPAAVDAAPVTADPDAAPAAPDDAAPAKPGDEMGRLRVRGTRGARVFLDGRLMGTSPRTVANLAPRRYLVELKKNGFQSAEKRVRIRSGKTETLHAVLVAEDKPLPDKPVEPPVSDEPGDIRVKSTPTALVFVDGKRVAFSDWSRKFAPGPHQVRFVNHEHNIDESVTVRVKPGQATKVICSKAATGAYSCRVR